MFKMDLNSRTKTRIKIAFIGIYIILIIFILIVSSASAYERPKYKDGVAARWHFASICIPCHYTIADTEKATAISGSCENCHKYRLQGATAANDRKIDMSKIENIHLDIICIRCHVGPKSRKEITATDFHRVMSKTACLSCHTFENGTYKKPLKTECSDCHRGGPHVVHGERLGKMCVVCHGEDIGNFINVNTGGNGNKVVMQGPNTSISEISGKSGYLTIGQLIMEILGQFSKILGE
jgi:hypothetical protein